ncbi:Ni,Fe-hydrogenase III component G [Caldanaerobacter subterraneus subsp. tengcongensis MB4]|uniref:EchD n=3 Tax=Caldanaerobacter subterraneus TaxID=911092 RepID=Q8RDB5_CALS4|nr:NADH-quinone oxidoreductase subunit C [Caldanaerobacter subterraneus]AAM23430.1 echD [Caldanaerobacter subterraneus subsp. tengcongensis MB4]ERM91337.1 NADH dehydrogenase [Caldanaerobacter subterraneus subsp. yonseiensis KB-1]MBE3578365.1 NADH-quinone oxidoreductase subunit C [Caldanaerobacter subterraneus]MCS3917092.1 Ni,Fe-hydrogenase III component G [Caldanaerobacter subterraneus subsp. tengcongensis MB4]NNG66550.1 NADH-quinone oxidoreductase subunit C [Caldanaerobacter subterraneus]
MIKTREVKLEEVEKEAKYYYDNGYRFVTETCLEEDGKFRIIYTFEKDSELESFHTYVSPEEEVPSISKVYFAAIPVENEIHEMFGLRFKNLALDFQGLLFLGEFAPISPQASIEIMRRDKGDKNE